MSEYVYRRWKRNALIHAAWIITILVAVIAAQMLGTIQGDKINDYISFASSLASLILAIIAIFYAMISNQSFSETIGSLRNSAETVEGASSRICDVSAELGIKSEQLLSQIAEFKPTLHQFSERLDNFSLPAATAAITNNSEERDETGVEKSKSNGSVIASYIISLSFAHKKSFSIDSIVANLSDQKEIWDNWLSGYFNALNQFPSRTLRLARDGYNTYRVDMLNPEQERIGLMAKEKSKDRPFYSEFFQIIDEHFGV